MRRFLPGLILVLLAASACFRSQPEIVVVTSTPEHQPKATDIPFAAPTTQPLLTTPLSNPTADPTRQIAGALAAREYVVQPGDTMSAIAAAHNVTLTALASVNPGINLDIISVGQVIKLPEPPSQQTINFKIIPDSRLVRGPGSDALDVTAFINQQPGYARLATDVVAGDILTAAQVIQRVSLEFSVDARLLLALLEYKSGWLTNPEPSDDLKTYPMGAQASPLGFDRNGLYRQMTWTADQLNRGYYGWKYGTMSVIGFEDGVRLAFAPGLNAGTAGVQYLLSQYNRYDAWVQQVSSEGFYRTYVTYFGDPFVNAVDPLVPPGIQQPPLTLPFPSGETWFYTGGPHGGWGSGSAWAAIDFAPPDDRPAGSSGCYTSEFWATAVAPGVIARTDVGVVVLDLDGDGSETTGWSILYLHIAAQDRIGAHTVVEAGDRIGRPSCEGGFSNGTHMHIARRYNGEWLPADCSACPPDQTKPSFTMSGWSVVGLTGQEYQGYLVNGGDRRVADQGRLTPDNRISW